MSFLFHEHKRLDKEETDILLEHLKEDDENPRDMKERERIIKNYKIAKSISPGSSIR